MRSRCHLCGRRVITPVIDPQICLTNSCNAHAARVPCLAAPCVRVDQQGSGRVAVPVTATPGVFACASARAPAGVLCLHGPHFLCGLGAAPLTLAASHLPPAGECRSPLQAAADRKPGGSSSCCLSICLAQGWRQDTEVRHSSPTAVHALRHRPGDACPLQLELFQAPKVLRGRGKRRTPPQRA